MSNGVIVVSDKDEKRGPGRPRKVDGGETGNGEAKFVQDGDQEVKGFKPFLTDMETGTVLDGIKGDVFLDRYSLKDEMGRAMEKYPEQMWKRVAWGLSRIEVEDKRKEWEEKFYKLMEGFKFVPAGRILSGAGTGYEVTFYNCYVIPSPPDSRGGIMDSVKTTVEIQARGGGVGLNLSTLRPRGARVKKVNGTSSGAVNWAKLYSTANHDIIQQGGSRRGALMLMLNDWHPDVWEFITIKEDLSQIPGANLSVCVSDRFMEAVKNDKDWELGFPDLEDSEYDEVWSGDVEEWKAMGKKFKVYKTVKARQMWSRIAEAAWRSAEPGLMFIDRYNKMSNTWYFEKIIATNPCVTGDTLVSTEDGLVRIEDLVEKGRSVKVLTDGRLSKDLWHLPVQIAQTGKKEVFRLLTKEGYQLRLTKDHKVRTNKGWKEASDLVAGDRLLIANRKGGFGVNGNMELGHVLGWLVGDGTMKAAEAVLSFFGKEKHELAHQFAAKVNQLVDGTEQAARSYDVGVGWIDDRDEARVSSVRLWRLAMEHGITPENKLVVPEEVFIGSEDMQKGFLQALFTADGHVAGPIEKGVSVRLTSVSYEMLVDVQRLLLNFGIASKIYKNRRDSGMRSLPDGKGGKKEYFCREYHDLVIAKDNLWRFGEEVGFLVDYKNARLVDSLRKFKKGPYKERFLATFESLVSEGEEEVYDLTESVTRSFVANGLVVHNCGEQGLGAWGVCNLGAMNLSAYVKDERMDLKFLAEDVKAAVRLLDNVIDSNYYFNEENKRAQMGIRRTGLGTMGLGDALIKMKIRYGSDESLVKIEEIYKTIRDAAYEASTTLAEEKGVFGNFNTDKYLKGEFIQRLPEEIKTKIKNNGIRNAVILTQAPTGTTSLIAGVSSGIEPVYEFAFKRKDRTGEHVIYHQLFEEWMKNHEGESAPDYFVGAKQLTPEDHVRVQAMVQKYTDSSISKTVNAPNGHTIADVERLYTLSYDLGCKGIAYFRDGSRMGVLASLDDEKGKKEKEEAKKHEIKERPVKVEGATYKIATPLGHAFITVNNDHDGNPFEVFVTIGKAGSEIAAMAEALGRLISTTLRFGNTLPAKERAMALVEQLHGIGGPRAVGFGPNKVRSLPDAVAKAIAMHFGLMGFDSRDSSESESRSIAEKITQTSLAMNSTESTEKLMNGQAERQLGLLIGKGADLCPECKEPSFVYEEGCKKCHGCGYSEC